MDQELRTSARRWFHAAAWFGLAATTYTNYRAAPVADLQVAYLAVPVLLACVSEGLIRTWASLGARLRLVGAGVAGVLICVSYEHLRHMTLAAGGTWFSANIGAAAIDGTIFACVLLTCVLSQDVGTSQDVLTVPSEVSRLQDIDETPGHLERDTETPAIETPGHRDTLERDTETPPSRLQDIDETSQYTPRANKVLAGDGEAFAVLRTTFGQERPGVRAAMRALQCGEARARRLVDAQYGSHRGAQV